MEEAIDREVVEWARRLPVAQIPRLLAYLSARLLAEGCARHDNDLAGSDKHESNEKLLTAGELADRMNLHESWIRNEERLGRIPSIRAGRYVRFKLSEVEKNLAERKRLSPKSRSVSDS
jgi:excisionase family DNA binding protein